MKLITENIHFNDLEVLKEESENGKKKYKIKGKYLQSEVLNKNKRKYPRPIVEREVAKLNKEKINENRAYGELDHPPTPTVSVKNASHLIRSLEMNGNDAIGVSEVLDTPSGRIVTSILDAGGKLMMSSRGLGSLKGSIVSDNFVLVTTDIVSDGSAPDSYLEGILESKEFIIGNDGNIVEEAIENLQNKVDKKYNNKLIMVYMREFLDEIRSKI